jgi:transcriptional regulator with XRE-family HTH domain
MVTPIRRITRGQVRAARGFVGWQIKELASRSGTAVNTISKFENGLADASLETLLKLQGAFEAAGIDFPDDDTVSARRMREKSQSADL